MIEHGNEKREKTEASILCTTSEIMAATPNPYTCKQPSVDCTVSYTCTHSQHANIRIYSLPDPPSFSKHMHTHRCTHSNSKGQIHGLWSRQKVVNSCATRCATSQDSSKGWCTLSLFTCRDSRQTVACAVRCTHQIWHCSCHSFKAVVKTSRRTDIEDGAGAWSTTNGCNLLKSSPEVLFFMKNEFQE